MTTPASEFKFEGSNERAIGANGEINADSKRDLLQKQMALMIAHANSVFVTDKTAAGLEAANALVEAALTDVEAHKLIGEQFSDEVYMYTNRNGFARRALSRIELRQGMLAWVPMKRKGATIVYATSPTSHGTVVATDLRIGPPEFNVTARPAFRRPDAVGGGGMNAAEAFIMGIEAVMVAEDRLWLRLVREAAKLAGNTQAIKYADFSGRSFVDIERPLTQNRLMTSIVYMAGDVWNSAISKESIYNLIDPVSNVDLLLTGTVGSIFGKHIVTDAHRRPEHKVFSAGDFFTVAEPLSHGSYSDRNGLMSMPCDPTENGNQANWVMYESLTMAISDEQSVSFAQIEG